MCLVIYYAFVRYYQARANKTTTSNCTGRERGVDKLGQTEERHAINFRLVD